MVKLANIKHLKEVIFYGVLIMVLLLACQPKDKDKSLKIYHLKPNDIGEFPHYKENKKYYELSRDDFFVIKNFDKENEKHKTKVDSFVVNYIQKDSFLYKNKNAKWSLTFFKYGDGIDENTEHRVDTDYTMHTLFAPKKEIAIYTFDSKIGYRGSFYWINQENFESNDEKRKIISDYFKEHPIKESW
ncbi:hypothetical protein AQ1689_70060 [Tenacibaculum maritimum]|uniref:hypothetical protein n=5 Tax=Tenacibaculum maritimum TaxID=107401 RepID=UPI0012E58E15|nr:hypothetical protein [Tenacibaculum maritimum]CAA0188742.1 hypothetical protein AQ1689_70060 [Tenacibaculum maritimum]CAA0192349.1 hypothetical protein AQ1688_60059 [Tenacibaculum maritimum]CAA0195614.1 hypothetical protein AQ1685_70060 [Tenacibaculum maritimum]